MVVLLDSSKLPLPPSISQSSSLLYEPNSLSLALSHFDSSISLFPSLPFPSFSIPSNPQTLIPPPCTSSSFVILQPHQHKPEKVTLFLVASPFNGGTQILFRFYLLQKTNLFVRVSRVVCDQKGLLFDPKLGVLLDIHHGVSVRIVGSVNYFVLHCVSSNKVWVFGVKLMDDDQVVKLMRCAVIDCVVPVWFISLNFGLLMFGEDNGVRVLNLRKLLKGGVKKVRSSNSDGNLDLNERKVKGHGGKLRNELIGEDHKLGSSLENKCNGILGVGGGEKNAVSVKQKFVRSRGDTTDGDAHFVAFKEFKGGLKSPVRAISIQGLSQKRFIVLDSIGDLHMLYISKAAGGSNLVSYMLHLPQSLKVQKLAVLPDISSSTHTVWVADGSHSLHMLTMSDVDDAVDKSSEDDRQAKSLSQSSVRQVIFAGEKICEIVPFSMNGILILGQGSLCSWL